MNTKTDNMVEDMNATNAALGSAEGAEGKKDKGTGLICALATAGLLLLFVTVGIGIVQSAGAAGIDGPGVVAAKDGVLPGSDSPANKAAGSSMKPVGDLKSEKVADNAPEGEAADGDAPEDTASAPSAVGEGTGAGAGQAPGNSPTAGSSNRSSGSNGNNGSNSNNNNNSRSNNNGGGGSSTGSTAPQAPAPQPQPQPVYGWITVTEAWTEYVEHPGVWGIVGNKFYDACNTCNMDVTGFAPQHAMETGHAGHHIASIGLEGWVSQAWTETIQHPAVREYGIIGYQ